MPEGPSLSEQGSGLASNEGPHVKRNFYQPLARHPPKHKRKRFTDLLKLSALDTGTNAPQP